MSHAKLLFAGLILLALATTAYGGPLGVDYTDPTIIETISSYVLGYGFNVTQPVQIIGLAFYDDYGDGLLESHDVGLWDPLRNLIAQATVGPSSPLIGLAPFRWATITPVPLAIGDDYRVAAVTGSENYSAEPSTLIVDPHIEFVFDQYADGTTLVYPDLTLGAVGAWGGNVVLSEGVPEPSSLLLFGGGALALLLRRRR
jgi:hypothetical protein